MSDGESGLSLREMETSGRRQETACGVKGAPPEKGGARQAAHALQTPIAAGVRVPQEMHRPLSGLKMPAPACAAAHALSLTTHDSSLTPTSASLPSLHRTRLPVFRLPVPVHDASTPLGRGRRPAPGLGCCPRMRGRRVRAGGPGRHRRPALAARGPACRPLALRHALARPAGGGGVISRRFLGRLRAGWWRCGRGIGVGVGRA